MNERMHESLSALLDGESDELEVRRSLKEIEQHGELLETWRRYHMIGAAMRGEPLVPQVDLSKGIRQALDGEPMDDVIEPLQAVAVTKRSGRMRWLASGAVAASVTLAVLFAVNTQEISNTSLVAQGAGDSSAVSSPIAASQEQAVASVNAEETARLEEAQRKLQEYIMQHNEHATVVGERSVVPYVRVVNFEQGSEAKK